MIQSYSLATFSRFVQRYKMLVRETWPNHPSRNDRTACEVILKAKNFSDKDVAYGQTKVR